MGIYIKLNLLSEKQELNSFYTENNPEQKNTFGIHSFLRLRILSWFNAHEHNGQKARSRIMVARQQASIDWTLILFWLVSRMSWMHTFVSVGRMLTECCSSPACRVLILTVPHVLITTKVTIRNWQKERLIGKIRGK